MGRALAAVLTVIVTTKARTVTTWRSVSERMANLSGMVSARPFGRRTLADRLGSVPAEPPGGEDAQDDRPGREDREGPRGVVRHGPQPDREGPREGRRREDLGD